MINFRPRGGLGNQLFTYAVAKNVALRRSTGLTADLIYFNDKSSRELELNSFRSEIGTYRHTKGLLPAQIRRFFPLGQVYFERSFLHDSSVYDAPDNVTLDGYFQSWRYVEGVSAELRQELRAIISMSDWCERVSRDLRRESNSTFLHVRRGDYIPSSFGLVSKGYYQRAIEVIDALDGKQEIFLFSDSPTEAWSMLPASLRRRTTHIATPLTVRPIEVMNVMAATKNAVIANSTFSWWAAWLGKAKGQIVIHPKPWIDRGHMNDRDLHPPDWIALGRNQ